MLNKKYLLIIFSIVFGLISLILMILNLRLWYQNDLITFFITPIFFIIAVILNVINFRVNPDLKKINYIVMFLLTFIGFIIVYLNGQIWTNQHTIRYRLD
jgi:hypothetical protein